MAITKPILGKWITLRCAEESDAEFTLAIRNDLKLTKFIPKVMVILKVKNIGSGNSVKNMEIIFL